MTGQERTEHDGAPRPSPRVRLHHEAAHLRTSLLTLGPPTRGRWPLAIQAALAMAVPVVVLSAMGRADLGLLAATGAFTGLYGGRATPENGEPSSLSSRWPCCSAPRPVRRPRPAAPSSC